MLSKHFHHEFIEPGIEVKTVKGWHWGSARSHMKKMIKRYGFVAADRKLEGFHDEKHTLVWPHLVDMVLPLPTTWEAFEAGLVSSSARRDIRRWRANGIVGKRGLDRDRLVEFRTEHHGTGIRARHGANGQVYSLAFMQKIWDEGGDYVEMWLKGEWIGGYLGRVQGRTFHLILIGWKSGRNDLRKKGVVQAIYLDVIDRAIGRGLDQINFGGVPPYLDNGLLAFKAKWGGLMGKEPNRYPAWDVTISPSHPSVRWFFQRHSLLLKNEANSCFDVLSGRSREEVRVISSLEGELGAWDQLA